ncbi:MAG TPA: DUF3274 domain-containing protein [Telluria sp.]|jgi:pimeloyl-ACP methyl ester carboxylesterase
MGIYKKMQYVVGKDTSVLQCNRFADKTVNVRSNLPGNVIVIHGVNDVGTSYQAVEQGLCAGLKKRIGWNYVSGTYRMPQAADKGTILEDPDAVFFKRQINGKTHSPVIPFYWGYREVTEQAGSLRGQRVDRYFNRLDKDLSKGGGPFANATSTLPDMWGQGKSGINGLLDAMQKDATHPVLDNPGHLYMILAAKRLAALIAMIRDYDENEAVTLVAHSQGCMLSLLAQAFLLEDGLRPADTLILNNPPYGLVDEIPRTTNLAEGTSGEDAAMAGQYGNLSGRQTLHARLQTLVNIVHGVVSKKHASPAFTTLNDQRVHHGMVSSLWKASADRDNRGKVYLYFCPEDMTVALNNVQGIGWQGVPDSQKGKQVKQVPELMRDAESRQTYKTGRTVSVLVDIERQPMAELTALNQSGAGFYQRVFSMKLRPDPVKGEAVLIGQASPHDFVLRTKGEDDQGHTAVGDDRIGRWFVHAHLPTPPESKPGSIALAHPRQNIRTINGESLPVPVTASLTGRRGATTGVREDAAHRPGALEDVDPIDAAIAVTSNYGLTKGGIWELWHDSGGLGEPNWKGKLIPSPASAVYDGMVLEAAHKKPGVQTLLNQGKTELQRVEILAVFDCVRGKGAVSAAYEKQMLVNRSESTEQAQLRWQNTSSARSFHGAIFGGADNHRQVTAYDIAIGGGKASTDPLFYQYLCAVADWRLKQGKSEKLRPSIMSWEKFLHDFAVYWKDEPQLRKAVIDGNANYYSSGILPECVPKLMQLPLSIVCETLKRLSFERHKQAQLDSRKASNSGKVGS